MMDKTANIFVHYPSKAAVILDYPQLEEKVRTALQGILDEQNIPLKVDAVRARIE
jgi:hypothetical protein